MTRDVAGHGGEARPSEQAARFVFAQGLIREAGALALRSFKDFATLQVFAKANAQDVRHSDKEKFRSDLKGSKS